MAEVWGCQDSQDRLARLGHMLVIFVSFQISPTICLGHIHNRQRTTFDILSVGRETGVDHAHTSSKWVDKSVDW